MKRTRSSLQALIQTCQLDASFNNLPDGGSQGGHIIFLTDIHNKCCSLIWNSSKAKRVVNSTIAVETLALNEGCETAMYLSQYLEKFSIWSTYQSSGSQITNCFIMSLTLITDRLLWVEIAIIRHLCERKQSTS